MASMGSAIWNHHTEIIFPAMKNNSFLLPGFFSRKHYQAAWVSFGKPACILNKSRTISCQVKDSDSEDILTGENVLTNEKNLLQNLQIAVENEQYAEAARIRDTLRLLREDDKSAILALNSQFYNAFRKGDMALMQNLWAKTDGVCCVHPGAAGVHGYKDVMESWEVVWMNYDFPLEIELKNVEVYSRSEMGYVSCVEFIKTKGGNGWGAQYVSNVYEKIDGKWFICIHHASVLDL